MAVEFVFISFLVMCFFMGLTEFPLSLGASIFLMSFIIMLLTSVNFEVFLGLILLLVFVGGLLVAFGYAVALASNPVFSSKFMISFKTINKALSGVMLVFLIGLLSWSESSFNCWNFEVESNFQFRGLISLFEGWGETVLFMGILLLVVMVGVVSICFLYKGALVEFKRSVN